MLNKFRFKTQKFQRYLPKPEVPGSIPSEEVIALEHDAFGKLWIGFHRSGIAKYNHEEDNFSIIELPEFGTWLVIKALSLSPLALMIALFTFTFIFLCLFIF